MRILFVGNNSETSKATQLVLSDGNFNVHTTSLGDDAIDLVRRYDYDLVFLDSSFSEEPNQNIYDVLRELKISKVETPIIVLSDKNDINEILQSFNLGVDDVIQTPFVREELIARVRSVVRRSKGHSQSIIETGEISVNIDTKVVKVNGKKIHLTGREYQTMELLSLRKDETVTKEMFLNHLYGGIDDPEAKIIDVFICKLRKKIAEANNGKTYIKNIYGRGHSLKTPSDDVKLINKELITADSDFSDQSLMAAVNAFRKSSGASPEASNDVAQAQLFRILRRRASDNANSLDNSLSESVKDAVAAFSLASAPKILGSDKALAKVERQLMNALETEINKRRLHVPVPKVVVA